MRAADSVGVPFEGHRLVSLEVLQLIGVNPPCVLGADELLKPKPPRVNRAAITRAAEMVLKTEVDIVVTIGRGCKPSR